MLFALGSDFKIFAHVSVTAYKSAPGLKLSPPACFLASAGKDLISHLTSSGVGDSSPSSVNEVWGASQPHSGTLSPTQLVSWLPDDYLCPYWYENSPVRIYPACALGSLPNNFRRVATPKSISCLWLFCFIEWGEGSSHLPLFVSGLPLSSFKEICVQREFWFRF